ncbi:hypothetical protein MJ588_18340 [Klebsiella pneumoniae]|nr:hypothetical protein MJ588_18340 [Klebsiella pneumoniae]
MGLATKRRVGALEAACCSRGTPRIGQTSSPRWVRDFAEVSATIGTISADIAAQALDMLNVDAEGFDYMDRKLLLAVIQMFFGGPVGQWITSPPRLAKSGKPLKMYWSPT